MLRKLAGVAGTCIAFAFIAGKATAESPLAAGGIPAPGTVVESRPFDNIDEVIRSLGGESIRIRYASTFGRDGSRTLVSGAVFLPGGTPPDGGWPILAFAHGTTGINYECGPSLSPNLLGQAPAIAGFLRQGFAVAVPDYQGLGEPGIHPYLDARTAGLNVIDAVRALRALRPASSSESWLVFGGSQGGGAAWAANEQVETYAPELTLLGAVAVVPAANLLPYVTSAIDGTLGPDQRAVYVWVLMSLTRLDEEMNADDYRSGSAKDNWKVLSYCSGPDIEKRNIAIGAVTAAELVPRTDAAGRRIREEFEVMALPQIKASAPMLVIYGGQDTYLDSRWTRSAIEKACAMGTPVEEIYQPEAGHGSVDIGMVPGWLQQRLAGDEFVDTC